MNNIVSQNYGTHDILEVFYNSFDLKKIIIFLMLFFVGNIIGKIISKKCFLVNKRMYLFLGVFYLIISMIKAYILSKIPPHDLGKDLCGIGYSFIQMISVYHIPIIYTIIILARLIDKKIKDKRRDNK